MDVSGPLQTAFQQILEQVDSHIIRLEEGFARKLADWTKSEQQSGRLICIEDVLSKMVVPVAKEHSVCCSCSMG